MKEGWHSDISNEDYHRGKYATYLGSSSLKEFARSPWHFQQSRKHPKPTTAAMELGTLTHTAIFEPEKEAYAVWAGGRRSGKVWDAFKSDADFCGLPTVTASEHEAVLNMKAAVMADETARATIMVPDKQCEITGIYQEPSSGVWCKIRPDLKSLKAEIIVDLKTTVDGSPEGFGWEVWNRRYHWSALHYKIGADLLDGISYRFYWMVVEKSPGFPVMFYEADDEWLWHAGLDIDPMYQHLARCKREDKWPGYGGGMDVIPLPMPYRATQH